MITRLSKIISQQYKSLSEHYAVLSLRERILYSTVSVGILLFIIDQSMLQAIAIKRDHMKRQIELTQTSIDHTRTSIKQIDGAEMSESDREFANQITQLHQQIGEIERQMQATVEALVPPRAIVAVLEELLDRSDDLRIVRLHSHAPQPITSGFAAVTEANPINQSATAPRHKVSNLLYRHGLTLEIEGSYPAATAYLRRIESSPWHLLWERFEYSVEKYPKGHILIDLHTISDQEEWIGV